MMDHPPTRNLDDQTACELYQKLLDITTRLVHTGDADAFADHIFLPYVFRTGAGEQICESRDDLRKDTLDIHQWLKTVHATDYYRIAKKARFHGPNTIEGFHVTYALRGAIPIVEPYASRLVMHRVDGAWRAAFSEHELVDPLFATRNVKAFPGLFSDGWHDVPELPTSNQSDALPTYRGAIEKIHAAVEAQDFDGWFAHFAKPFQVHDAATDHMVTTQEEAVPFFDTLRTQMRAAGADRFRPMASSAAFLLDDRLIGYHETTMLRGNDIRLGPIKCRMIFVLRDGNWLCNSLTTAQSNTGSSADQLPTMREIQRRMQK